MSRRTYLTLMAASVLFLSVPSAKASVIYKDYGLGGGLAWQSETHAGTAVLGHGTGGNIHAHFGLAKVHSPLAARLVMTYAQGARGFGVFQPSPQSANDFKVAGGGADLMVGSPRSSGPYVLGGAGLYHLSAKVVDAFGTLLQSESATKVGFSAGAGLRLWQERTGMFLEMKYNTTPIAGSNGMVLAVVGVDYR